MSSNIIPLHAGEFGLPGNTTTPTPSIFDFGEHMVRVVMRDGDPWFVMADLCRVLAIRNPRDAAARLEEHEKGVCSIDTLGGKQEMVIVNESGAMATILSSRKPEARAFRVWVTGTVLPSIRKTGVYVAPTATMEGVKAAAELSANANLVTQIDVADRFVARRYKNLSETAQTALIATVVNAANGREVLPLPVAEKMISTTELAGILSSHFGKQITPKRLGTWANNNNMKREPYGEVRLSKSPWSDKQVEQWHWSEAGILAVAEQYQ